VTHQHRRALIRFRRGTFDLMVGVIVLLIVAGLYLIGSAVHGAGR
jgi:uncharacterized membrane protein SpoIIM required for sporulation